MPISLHQQAVLDNVARSKHKAKRDKHRLPWNFHKSYSRVKVVNVVTPGELRQKLSEFGIDIGKKTIENYTYKYKCITPPEIGRGGVHGTWSDYPDHSLAEAVASYRLIKGKGGMKAKAEIMNEVFSRATAAEQADEENPGASMDLILQPSDQLDTLAWYWLMDKRKIMHGFKPDDRVSMGVGVREDGTRGNTLTLNKPIPDTVPEPSADETVELITKMNKAFGGKTTVVKGSKQNDAE